MQEVIQFASELGFKISSFDLDGKVHRFDHNGKKKNAWYVGWQHHGVKSGDTYYICIIGNWSTGEKHEYKSHGKKLSREDHEIIKKKIIEAATLAEVARKERQDEAAKKAKSLLAQMRPVAISDYLVKKKITDLHGAGTVMNEDGDRVIVVPMYDIEGILWGAQRILPNGSKFFLTGQLTSGCFHVMGDPEESFVYLAEGFATAAAIRQATGKTVFVCFNADNLKKVARAIRAKWVNRTMIICGDDDRFTEGNPGRTKAEEAAKSCIGKVIYPVFKDPSDKNLTDFNDLYVTEGLDIVKKQLENLPKPSPLGFIPLGTDEGCHFFYDIKSRGIKKTSTLSATFLFELMPIEYWDNLYGTKKGGINFHQAISDLIQKSKDAGPFDSIRIKGTGVWFDNKRTVINTGDGTICNGNLSQFKSHYIYIQTKNKMPPIHTKPLTTDESSLIRHICEDFKWKDKKSGYFLAGWIAIARIAGAFPVRPHIWLTGGANTGKSSVLDLIGNALGSPAGHLFLQGGTTEAGIRQSIKADSLPIVFDEFETNSDFNNARNQSILELFRQTWSQTQGHIVKGSAGGTASHYALSFAACVASIRVVLDNEADKSRFSILDLIPHGGDKAHWEPLKKKIQQVDEEYGERLFARSCGILPVIFKNYEVFSDHLSRRVNTRFGQQHGMLLAGWYSLLSDTVVTNEIASSVVDDLDLDNSKNEAQGASDEVEILSTLMTTRLTVQDDMGNRKDASVELLMTDEKLLPGLKSYGILVEPESISIANSHASLKRSIFANTKWSVNWSKSLLRIKGAEKDRKRFGGTNAISCITIPKTSVTGLLAH